MPGVEPDAADDLVDDAEAAEEGMDVLTASVATTGLFTAAAVLATVFPDQAARPVAVLDLLLFVAGLVAFGMAFAKALGRSRTEQIDVARLFFLAAGTAPRTVRNRLLGCLAIQIVVAFTTSSIRLYTEVAYGILVPMLGLGLAGLWGARHGAFPARPPR